MRILGLGVGLSMCLAACGGESGPPAWNKQPMVATSGTVGGIAFTIDLPKGMEPSSVNDDREQAYAYHADGRTYAPRVSVTKFKKQSLADAKAMFSKTDAILHEAETPTGWVYAVENSAYKGKQDYLVYCQTYVGEDGLDASVRIYPVGKSGGSTKELIPDAEKLCQSLKAK
jgi:hypothetical protein